MDAPDTLGWGLSTSNFVADEIYTLSLITELSEAVSLPITISFGNFPNYLSLANRIPANG